VATDGLAIYVSASPEMDAECELVGQLLADMPRSVEWRIRRTPVHGEHENPDLDGLCASQFYLILLGMDITAPIGVEWLAAQDAGLTTFAFRKVSRVPSPAAAFFAHNSAAAWRPYRTPQEFIQRFERELIARLIEGTPGYGLALADIEELSERLEAPDSDVGGSGGEERRGAGGGGVILPAD